jgi:hypothetical protein
MALYIKPGLWPYVLKKETDCATAVQLIKGSTPNSSVYAFQVLRIRDLFKERECKCVKIDTV